MPVLALRTAFLVDYISLLDITLVDQLLSVSLTVFSYNELA